MGQLADRIAHLLREHGMDPAARQSDLHALAAIEDADPKLAHERFLEMKRQLLVEHRALLFAELRTFDLARDVPGADARGYPLKEIEADLREATRALALAREIRAALADEVQARSVLRSRGLAPAQALAPRRWDDLRPLVADAETRRRAARREARVEERARDAERRAAKVALAAPDVAALDAEAAHATLDTFEAKLAQIEALHDARAAAHAPLADPAVREWRRESMRTLARAIDGASTVEELRALTPRAAALREEAAREATKAARARKSGHRGPERERRAGDAMDPYG